MSEPAVDISSAAPKWTTKERELWLDLFANFCTATMGATLEECSGIKQYPEEQLKSDVTLSADLADHALQEVQYRFDRNTHQTKQRAAKRR